MLSKKAKEELLYAASEILRRVDVASNGCHNIQHWDDAADNAGAPEGMSYEDWIEEAETLLLTKISLS